MADYRWGYLGRRQLHIRTLTPWCARSWDGFSFRFSWLKAINPLNVFRAVFNRYHWSIWAKRWTDLNHRCYCPVGSCIDGRIELAGYGIQFWYSNYTGEIPCWCDKALEELLRIGPLRAGCDVDLWRPRKGDRVHGDSRRVLAVDQERG